MKLGSDKPKVAAIHKIDRGGELSPDEFDSAVTPADRRHYRELFEKKAKTAHRTMSGDT